MSLTNDDLDALKGIVRELLEPVYTRLDSIDTKQDTFDARQVEFDARQVEFDARIDKIDTGMQKFDARIDKIDTRVDRAGEILQSVHESQLRVELEWYPKIEAALEGAAISVNKNAEQDERLSALENITEDNSNRIFALEHIT